MKLSILAINWHAQEWAELLVKSVKDTVSCDYEILIVDNSNNLKPIAGATILKPPTTLSHGLGMNWVIPQAKGEFVFAIDIDAHFLLKDWDKYAISYFEKNNLKLIACQGGLLKPIRPCGMLFKRDWFVDNKMDFTAREFDGVKFDVGVHFYFKTLTLAGQQYVKFFPYHITEFKGSCGSEYLFGGKRFLYHNYYSTRWFNIRGERVHDRIGRMTWEKFSQGKENLWKQLK
jgi:hypothetical protein